MDKKKLENLKWLWSQTDDYDHREKISNVITSIKNVIMDTPKKADKRSQSDFEYDCFVCHASEDKESFVRDLVEKLRKNGYKIWYDEYSLTLGDSLRRMIDRGLAKSRFGVVVLSKYFFEKEWPQKELDGLVAKERGGQKVILPIWHAVTRKDVEEFSLILASRLAVSTNNGLENVVRQIIRAINKSSK